MLTELTTALFARIFYIKMISSKQTYQISFNMNCTV